ncbi:Integrase catalytic domain-containing protein [Abeliophyllum distichum]|uniref:Integrase catalytic domain-containing protein n=1 Tax=Abeliophyllum distichum TaxID=126358 RepID=A0ABD1UKV6_9LAMI
MKGYRLWDRSQTEGKVIVNRDVTFNEFEILCLGPNLEKICKDQHEGDSRHLETINVSTHIPSTSCEMEIQQPERKDIVETVIEECLDEEYYLRDYQLTRDRVIRPHRESQRFGYESDVAFAYANFE